MASVVLNGATSGQITLAPAAVAGTNTLTLPASTGTVLTTAGGQTITGTTTVSSLAMNGSTSGSITLTPTAVAGTNTITLAAQTGTLNAAGPTFSAYFNGSTQSITASTWTKITMNAKDFDTNTNYDATTNYRFTPTVAGYYMITSTVAFSGGGSATAYNLAFYKNGTLYKGVQAYTVANANTGASIALPILFNGSTDYVEVWVYGSQSFTLYGSTNTTGGGANANNALFNGYLVRGA
jgi:hypothetical protein